MSEKAFALIFINLGGEMLYVLDQRLYAQKIQVDKGRKIMQDIVSNMFSERFLDEIFRAQELCSRKALRTIFERLAHTSIMRLNESSMDKLYDLMTMAVKYQLSLVSSPKEILLVALNHLDSIIPFVADSSNCLQLIDQCYKRLYKTFSAMSDYELQFIRHTMLNFFQDHKIKVSVFLKEKLQNWNGTFVLYNEGPVAPGADIPGLITYYEDDGGAMVICKESKFNPGAKYCEADREGSYERTGDRVITLGLNIYNSTKPVDTIISASDSSKQKGAKVVSDYEANVPDPRAKAQLDLLCKLIGKSSATTSPTANNDFKLNLFNNEEEEYIYSTRGGGSAYDPHNDREELISFDASKRSRDDRLNKIMSQFDGRSQPRKTRPDVEIDDDDDIVTMMDKMNK